METRAKEYAVESTFFWFDLFVNDQWTASDKGSDCWWVNTFRETVEAIGHTQGAACLRGTIPLYQWNNPVIVTRVLVTSGNALSSPRSNIYYLESKKEEMVSNILFDLTLIVFLRLSARSMLKMPHRLSLKTEIAYLKSLSRCLVGLNTSTQGSTLQRKGHGANM